MNIMAPQDARGTRFLVLSLVLLAGSMAGAQGLTDEVHITPRINEKQNMVAGLTLPESSTKMLKVSVNLVLVPVTIVDDMNRGIKGLQSDNFDLFEGKHQQHIRYFSTEDVPITLGIVLDVSGSMKSKIERAQEAVHEFLKSANPEDEFFMVTFSDTPQMISGFTQRSEDVEKQLLYARPNGRTALLDALQLAMSKMTHARYQRKALLVISDGGDNHSRYTEGEVKSAFKEADVAMYAIGIFDRNFATSEEMLGPELLRELSDLTGGREFTIDNPNDLLPVAKIIGRELRNQYLLGYQPTVAPKDGKWHKIRIKFRRPKKVKLPPVHVYARAGYYARAD